MMKKVLLVITMLLFVLNAAIAEKSYENREEVPAKYKWDLTHLFKDIQSWEAKEKELQSRIDELSQFKGKLGESSKTLHLALSTYADYLKEYRLLSAYPSRLSDQDLSISANQELKQRVAFIGNQFSEKTSYIIPELINVGPEKIRKFIKEIPELEEYRPFLEDVIRQEAHTLSDKEEAIMSTTGLITAGPHSIFSVFANAEMPKPTVTLESGEEVTLTSPVFGKYRASKNRNDRIKVFKTFFENYGKFQNTYGASLVANLKNHHFSAKNRNYNSTLASALDGGNIPTSVYENLINQINKNLPILHRYVDLKKRMLGLDTLHYYDLYVPLVKKVNLEYSIEEGQEYIKKSLKPLGKEYIKTLDTAFEKRWIDYYPTPGKRSGAYSTGSAYDIHPYILMNWVGNYNSLSTLTHELGHTMHSQYSNTNQPFMKSNYSIFVAEIASTFNENLLNSYLLKKEKDEETRLFLLGSYLEGLRGTVFRQTMFAEFELDIHKKIENGEPLTGNVLSEMYLKLTRKYYGHDKGVCIVDPFIQFEWAYIPHFYYNYYVYQYATSLIYSTAFAEKVMNKEKDAVKNYYNLLKGGGSEYPTDIIKKAGIDPFSSDAFDLTMSKMTKVMDEIEKIINKK